MATAECPECGHRVERADPKCPECTFRNPYGHAKGLVEEEEEETFFDTNAWAIIKILLLTVVPMSVVLGVGLCGGEWVEGTSEEDPEFDHRPGWQQRRRSR